MPTEAKQKKPMTPQQRKQLAQKRRRRKLLFRRFIVFSCAALILASVVGLIYGFFTVFKITEFKTEGETKYTLEQVVSASGLKKEKNLFLSKLKPVRERLVTELPYIGDAQVRRVLPGTVVFKLTPAVPVGVLEYKGGLAFVDNSAKVLSPADEQTAGSLMRLQTPEPLSVRPGYVLEFGNADDGDAYDAETVNLFISMLSGLEYSGIKDITVMNLRDPNNVTLLYQDRIMIKLGVPSQVEKRLKLAAVVIEKENAISAFQKGEIDLTVGGAVYFKPQAEI